MNFSAESALHNAVRRRVPLGVLKLLIRACPEALSQQGKDGETPLHIALDRHDGLSDPDLIQLLASPEAVRVGDGYDRLPLHLVCRNGNLYSVGRVDFQVVKMLVDLFPESIVFKSNDCVTPFHLACSFAGPESAPAIGYMIQKYPECVMALDGDGNTPLHKAFQHTHINNLFIIRMLATVYPKGASVARAKDGFVPIHVACGSSYYAGRNYERLRYLVKTFPDTVALLDHDGCTPLHLLCKNPADDIKNRTKDDLVIIGLMCNEKPEVLRVADKDGHTPLHLACASNADDSIIRCLVQACPHVLEPSNGNTSVATPLHLACDCTYPSLSQIKLLSISEMAVKARNDKGETPLHLLCKNGAPSFCPEVLLDKYPDLIHERDNEGRTVLFVAIDAWRKQKSIYLSEIEEVRYEKLTQCLLDAFRGAACVADNHGVSPFMVAVAGDLSLNLIFQLISVDPIAILEALGG